MGGAGTIHATGAGTNPALGCSVAVRKMFLNCRTSKKGHATLRVSRRSRPRSLDGGLRALYQEHLPPRNSRSLRTHFFFFFNKTLGTHYHNSSGPPSGVVNPPHFATRVGGNALLDLTRFWPPWRVGRTEEKPFELSRCV